MASLNLSVNGPSIKSSYAGVVNAVIPKSSSSTYAHWALFSVQAPLVNAFQQDGGSKESILKVQTTGEGELSELIEDFNEGRIQFAYVKVKDPNTGLPKNVLIAWCGGGVPERTKGYFTSHLSAVSKVLHGYHVQITARSDADLEPEAIVQKVSDASGAKYTAGGSAPLTSAAPPAIAKKPVFTPTTSSTGGSFNPIVAARNRRQDNVDDDGWGADAPQVSRTQLEKVESAYKPTKVNMAELSRGRDESTRFNGGSGQDDRPGVVRGAYQPVGKVDINAIRAAAQKKDDDRPAPVKGSYEPVGKVDIAAIRARAQKPSEPTPAAEESAEPPKSLAERTAAFTQSERLTELPKPKVAKKFGAAAAFTGTKAPTPVGFGAPAAPAAPPVGAASRTFADQGGKTPAQIWAEKKAKERGIAPSPVASPPVTSPVTAQKSGSGWNSGYSGKSWAPVGTTNFGRGGVETQRTGGTDRSEPRSEQEAPASPAGGISAIRDRFKDAPPMGGATPAARNVPSHDDEETAPPPPPSASRPSGPSGGFALPGLPSRPAEEPEEEEEEEPAPAVPSRDEYERDESPPRVAIPVARSQAVEVEPAPQRSLPPPLPVQAVEQELPKPEELPEEEETHDPRAAGAAVAEQSFGHDQVAEGQAGSGGKRAVIQYDYEKAEDNEIDLVEGEYVTNIEMVDDDWWMGTNSKGESGLFPSNYVELAEDDDEAAPASHSAPAPAPVPAAQPEPQPEPASGGSTATALFDYEAAEDNELSFPEGARITDLEFPDDDWWFGHYKGASGLFPANYVELDA
ncbi:hypothetical protein CONLIGDRAFT_18583 [Coniochaeta ligniaria NRRL 30616]|uniref:Actin binding protein n=1 Tax=Coniochaeta ligniaria NRRL 30616 TaxID=1408157 RepID=A0A1J7JZ87_9PEZI|nr:hypothetical protein CONLIGDRAFT_18583 [Coniochaeta ligniaria NRRL 30616]